MLPSAGAPALHSRHMIGFLRGRLHEVLPTHVLLDVAGVGYAVGVSPALASGLHVGKDAFFYVYEHIREDAHDLYGFLAASDLALFRQLIGVSGVGPKSAMTILAVGDGETVRRAIMAGDLETLTSVPGVGKKTAQKIVLELKGQLVDVDETGGEDRDAIEALVSLGYPSADARDALKMVPTDVKGTSDRVRQALRFLAKH